jgi:hypothetical protein
MSVRSNVGSQYVQKNPSKSPSPSKGVRKVHIPPLSKEKKTQAVKMANDERCWEVLNQEDDYYKDLQAFRKLHPELTSKRVPARYCHV